VNIVHAGGKMNIAIIVKENSKNKIGIQKKEELQKPERILT